MQKLVIYVHVHGWSCSAILHSLPVKSIWVLLAMVYTQWNLQYMYIICKVYKALGSIQFVNYSETCINLTAFGGTFVFGIDWGSVYTGYTNKDFLYIYKFGLFKVQLRHVSIYFIQYHIVTIAIHVHVLWPITSNKFSSIFYSFSKARSHNKSRP